MKNYLTMKKVWVSILTSILLVLSTYATQIPIPNTPDSLEHFLENHRDMYANGDTILIVDSFYVVNGTADLYHGVTIMGDPALSNPPIIQFLDNGFRLKQDSTSVYIKGLNLNGFNDDKSHRAKFILRMDNIPASDSIFYNMVIEDVEAVGFGGGIDLHQQKHAQYDSITVNNVIWHDFSDEYCIDPNINFPGILTVTNSTFYNITHGFVKNPDFASDKNNYTKIPKTYYIDHNTFYNIGGVNNALIQVNDPQDSTVTFTFSNNIVEKLNDPTNVRPFRINESAGTFEFNTNVIYDFMPTNPDKMQYSFDSTVANQTNVTETGTITDDPELLDVGDFRLPLNSPLLTADTEGGQIGDPRWTTFEGVYVYEPEDLVFVNNPVQLEAAIVLASGDTVLDWTVENRYGGTRGMAEIVDSTGLLNPTVPGQVKVTATSVENSAFFDTLIVTIQDSIRVEGVTLKVDGEPEITEKEGDLDIIASLTPSNPTDPRVTFSLSDDNLATFYVRSDTTIELVAIANGVVSVYAVTEDGGFKDTIDITITNQVWVESISLAVTGGGEPTITSIGGTLQLEATITPENADNPVVTWGADPSDLATVADGLVTALQEGTVTITATAVDGSDVSGEIDIVIDVPDAVEEKSFVEHLKVIPNPAYDFITLNITQQSRVTIHSVVGEMVLDQIIEVGDSIDIQELTDGIYIVNVYIGEEVSTLRFVKE